MSGAKFNIEKFDKTRDFGLWGIKMRALLIQHGCEAALEVLPADMEAEAKVDLNRKSHSAVILCLGNKVLREVTGETTVAEKGLRRTGGDGDGLYVIRRTDRRDSHQSRGKSRSNSREALLDWIMDSGGSYHMTPRLDLFFDFLECNWDSVLLGDNMECKIRSIGKWQLSLMLVLMKRQSYASLTQKTMTYQRGETTCAGKAGSVWQEESRRTVKKLRKNNGLEFYNREFEQLCIESGVARHLTVARTPQQNGLAERMNRTLMDKSGHPGDYRMLRIFNCVAYSYVKQGKLEPRVVKCVLLGYHEGVKGYRLYKLDNESPKIVTSRDVVFNESVMYKDMLKDHGACNDKSVEELQVEVKLQCLNNRTLEEDWTDQEDGDDSNAGDQETNQASDLTDYQLVRDGEPRTTTRPLRFQDESNMVAYAFAAAEEKTLMNH
ncbi:retrotransposon protein, putative, ty1-copia subclass [Tanacetum coccineum]